MSVCKCGHGVNAHGTGIKGYVCYTCTCRGYDPILPETVLATVKAPAFVFASNNAPAEAKPVTDLNEHEVHDYCNKLIKQGYTVEAVEQMRTAAVTGLRHLRPKP